MGNNKILLKLDDIYQNKVHIDTERLLMDFNVIFLNSVKSFFGVIFSDIYLFIILKLYAFWSFLQNGKFFKKVYGNVANLIIF